MNRIGRPIAYLFIDVDAEAWLAETDKRREDMIRDKVITSKWGMYLCDTVWTFDLFVHAVANRVQLFK